MLKAGAGEIRVKNIQEILEPNAVMSNNKTPRTEATEKRDIGEDHQSFKKGKGSRNVNDKEMLELNTIMNNNNEVVTVAKGEDIEQVSRNDKRGEGRRDVNDKFATLSELGGVAVPNLTTSNSLSNSFLDPVGSLVSTLLVIGCWLVVVTLFRSGRISTGCCKTSVKLCKPFCDTF